MERESSMQTISRAIQILSAFSMDNKTLSLADFHRKLGIPKSSLQRILNTLVYYGYLDKDEKNKTYQLGIELFFLGHLVEKNSHLMSISKPFMKKLNKTLGEKVTLNIVHQMQRKCIGNIDSKHELTTISYIGQYSPLYAGASAKLLLAYLPNSERNHYFNTIEFEQITDKTIVDKEKLLEELSLIRERGYAISHGERVMGAFSISAPIRNRFEEVIAGISVVIPSVRVDKNKIDLYVSELINTANSITKEISTK